MQFRINFPSPCLFETLANPPAAKIKPSKGDPIWDELRAKLPVEKNARDKAERKKLFKLFDPNGNGYLSLAEVDRAMKIALDCEELFDAKPALMRAFQAAKNVNRGDKNDFGKVFYMKSKKFENNFYHRIHFLELLSFSHPYIPSVLSFSHPFMTSETKSKNPSKIILCEESNHIGADAKKTIIQKI